MQDELLAHLILLRRFGPQVGRPHVDSLEGSRYSNLMELGFYADGGVWRVTFAFDPARKAILLAAGNKAGGSEKRFYQRLIDKSERRLRGYLASASQGKKGRRSQ